MLMTAAGTVSRQGVLVLGAGVAGLQAVATPAACAWWSGVLTCGRPPEEQGNSLGARFIDPPEREAPGESRWLCPRGGCLLPGGAAQQADPCIWPRPMR